MVSVQLRLKQPVLWLVLIFNLNMASDMFYQGLPAAWYDLFFDGDDVQELMYYQQYIQDHQPALEVGVGTGRILLPLLARGYAVEGFDHSPDMLALCREKAAAVGLQPTLYQQSMQDLTIIDADGMLKQYGMLYTPLKTFCYMADLAQAERALQRFYAHLRPGGLLLLYMHLPWHNNATFGQWHTHEPRAIPDKPGQQLVLKSKAIHEPIEQLLHSSFAYHVMHEDRLIQRYVHDITTRWYSQHEIRMMLSQAGFVDLQVQAGYEDAGPYDMMLVRARKRS